MRRDLREIVRGFERDVGRVREAEDALRSVLRCVEPGDAYRALSAFLGGDGRYRAVGVDGSMATEERMEVLIFHVSAAAYFEEFELSGGAVRRELPLTGEEVSVSASVPLWSHDLIEIDPSLLVSTEQEFSFRVSSIPFSLMTMGELHLAHTLLDRSNVVYLDRLLTVTRGPLSRDVSEMLRAGYTSLEGLETPDGRLSIVDLVLAARVGRAPYRVEADPREDLARFLFQLAETVPPRPPYTPYFVLSALARAPFVGYDDLAAVMVGHFRERRDVFESCRLLGRPVRVRSAGCRYLSHQLRRLNKLALRSYGAPIVNFDEDGISRSVDIDGYWGRAWFAVESVVSRVFGDRGEGHTLQINGRWLTKLDLSAINLITLNRLVEEAVDRKVLLIGIAKDTLANEFSRGYLPYLNVSGIPALGSDRELLTMISSLLSSSIHTPWRTREYDSVFTTVRKHGERLVAVRRFLTRERMYVRGYFQLWEAPEDSSMRSPVFAYDRPYYPDCDDGLTADLEVKMPSYGGTAGVRVFSEDGVERSVVGDAVVGALLAAHNPNVIESLGHNYLLFLADKHVKHIADQARRALVEAANMEITPMSRRHRAYFASRRFREIRRRAEEARARRTRHL